MVVMVVVMVVVMMMVKHKVSHNHQVVYNMLANTNTPLKFHFVAFGTNHGDRKPFIKRGICSSHNTPSL